MNRLHDLVKPVLRFDQLAPTATQLGEAPQERLVDRAVDSQGDTRMPPSSGASTGGLVLVAYLTVGYQHEDRVTPGLFPSGRFW